MSQELLPSVNFNANPGLDEFDFLHATYSEEFRLRTQINSTYGVVDQSGDPATAPFTSSRPLSVSVSPVNPLTIDISAGFAISPNYMLIDIDSAVPSIPLPNIAAGNVYVIGAEYVLIPNDSTRLSRFGVPVNTRLFRPSNTPPDGSASTLIDSIVIANLNDWNNSTIYTDDRKLGIVPIAVVIVLSDPNTGALSLAIDLTRITYAFNRPWYSVSDISHRSKVGTGIISNTNAHGIGLQDLSSAGLTLYQQLKERGGIIAKDFTYYGYAGKFCSELISLNRIESDFRGTVATPTGELPVGGSFYFRTINLPIRPGSLYFEEQPWNPIPYTWVEGTRTIIIGSLENPTYYGQSLIFEYFSVSALEVSPESPTQGIQTINVSSPVSGAEFIISSGQALDTLAQTSISLPSVLGPIKKKYQLLCDGVGSLVLAPQVILTSANVQDLVGAVQTLNQAAVGARGAKLIVGLTRATERTIIGATSYDLNLQLRIIGTGEDGSAMQEVVTFKASQWKDQSSADVEEPMQFQTTINKYQQITSITVANSVVEPNNSGPDAIISIWADILETSANQELAKVSSFFWTGTTGIQLKDERIISTTLEGLTQRSPRFPYELPENDFSLVTDFLSTLLTPPIVSQPAVRVMTELDEDRNWSETWKDFSTNAASGSISLTDLSMVQQGLRVRITNDKSIRFVSGGGVVSDGDVTIGGTATVLLNNLVATINDPVFDSTWFATISTESNPPVTLTRNISYPEGFMENFRRHVSLTSRLVTAQTITVIINGIPFSADFNTDNNTTLANLLTAIDSSTLVGSITAIVPTTETGGDFLSFIINGNDAFQDFTVDAYVTGGIPPAVTINIPTSPFTLSSPSGGVLPTAHLPKRFLNKQTAWSYISRPILWAKTGLRGSVGLWSDSPATIVDKDKIGIAPGRMLTARRGIADVNRAGGEFLVTPSSLQETLDSAVMTVNNTTWNSGVQGSVKDTTIFPSQVDGSTNTFMVAESEYRDGDGIIFTANPVFMFSPSDVNVSTDIIMEKNHGLLNRQAVTFASTGVLPTGITEGDTYIVANKTDDTFQIASYPSGSPLITITATGNGTHSIMALPNGLSGNTVYYVTGSTPNGFKISTLPSGTAVEITTSGAGSFRASGTQLIVKSAGYANSTLSVVQEGVPETWSLLPYAPYGEGDHIAHAIVKAVKPLQTAEWRFKTIEQTGQWICSNGHTYVTVPGGHGITAANTVINVVGFTTTVGSGTIVEVWNQISIINPYEFSFANASVAGSGTLDYVTDVMGWSPWLPMHPLSDTSFRIDGPPHKSLYCIQVRFTGQPGAANGFSIYQFAPEISSATVSALSDRLDATQAEIEDARGSAGSLSDRLNVGMLSDGTLIQDTELTSARSSSIKNHPSATTLKDRLDSTDSLMWWLAGGIENFLNPSGMAYPQYENAILRGPASSLTSSGSNLQIGSAETSSTFLPSAVSISSAYISKPGHGIPEKTPVRFSSTISLPAPLQPWTTYYTRNVATDTFQLSLTPSGSLIDLTTVGSGSHTVWYNLTPLTYVINGRTFVHPTQQNLSFAGATSGTYYIYADAYKESIGRMVTSGNTETTNGVDYITCSTTPFTDVRAGHILVIPSLTVQGQPFFSPILSVSNNKSTVTVAGNLPILAAGVVFEVFAPRELTIGRTSTKAQTNNNLYLGQAVWNGASFSTVSSYQYLNRYISPLTLAAANSNYTITFNHNLGFVPRHFTLYFYLATDLVNPNKVLHIGDEAVVTANTMTLTVKNRYANQVAKSYDGTVQNGVAPNVLTYIQLMI